VPHTQENIFDQFDQPNVFDQFDEPTPARQPQLGDPIRPGDPTFEALRGPTGEVIETVVSSAVAEPIAGLAGLFAIPTGFIGGLAPGGETPLEKGQRFGRQAVEAARRGITIEPRTQAGEERLEQVGRVAELGVKAVRAPVAGLAGLFQLATGAGGEAAAETVRRITEEGIGLTAGRALQDIGAPPIVSALAETIPTGIATVAGVRTPFRRVPETRPAVTPRPQERILTVAEERAALGVPDQPTVTPPAQPVSVGRPTLDRPVDVTPTTLPEFEPPILAQQVVDDLRKGKPAKVAEAVLPDVEIVESAQRLGVDLNPEHFSTNTAFQDVARALKTKPGSELQAVERQALVDLSNRADELVTDIGGSLDKAAVSDDILLNTRTTIDDLQTRADAAYKTVNETIPDVTRVDTSLIKDHIDAQLTKFGGDESLLTTAEKRLFNMVNRKEADGTMTYAALDAIRRDVGDGFNKRDGPFRNDNDLTLRQIYGVLSDTQNGVAEAFGIGELYANARNLIVKRKGVEDSAVQLFGRNLTASLVPKFRQAGVALTKGDVAPLNRLMEALAEPRRGEVAATILGEIFAGGSRQGGALGTGFVNGFAALNRNATAKTALFRHLPPETAKTFNDIGRVMTGIVKSNAKSLANPSGSAGPIIAALESGNLATKLYSAGAVAAGETALTTVSGIPGLATTLRVLTRQGKTPQIVKADKFLTSQPFKDAMKAAIEGNTTRANNIAQNSPQFKAWAATLDENTAANIANTGFIAWLSSQDEQ